jgi:hypothetical protein
MNKLVLLCLLLSAGTCFSFAFSQNAINKDVSLSPLTVVMIKKIYTPEEINQLNTSADKLKMIEYYYSKSFEVLDGQKYSEEQLLKVDVLKYNLTRKLNENVTVFDQDSGLNILLYSLVTIDNEYKRLVPTHKTFEERNSKTPN